MTVLKRIDVTNLPDVERVAEEVRSSGEARVLHGGGEDLAIIVPIPKSGTRVQGTKTEDDYEAFHSAAGGWSDVDTDELISDIYADRRASNRPSVEL